MLVSSFNLSQSFNYTPYLFLQKTVQIRDQFFLFMDPESRDSRRSWRCVPGCNLSLRFFLDKMCLGRFVPWTMRPFLCWDRGHRAINVVYVYSPPTVRWHAQCCTLIAYSSIWMKRSCLSEWGFKYFSWTRQSEKWCGMFFALTFHVNFACIFAHRRDHSWVASWSKIAAYSSSSWRKF